MRTNHIRGAIATAMLAGALSGCATPSRDLYHWGDYESVLYAHFKGEAAPLQRDKLQRTAHKVQSLGEDLPPGFNAHLGLLHLHMGQLDEARRAFEAEASLFPESRAYMDFLLGRLPSSTVEAAQ